MDMDMETSSEEEEEEGMISKAEQEEDTYGRRTSEPDVPVILTDLEACRLDRNKLAKYCMMPWFDKYIEGRRLQQGDTQVFIAFRFSGAWVRYLIGSSKEGPVYRICQIDRAYSNPVLAHTMLADIDSGLCDDATKPYKIDSTLFDRNVELLHGKSRKTFPLDKVSNSTFSPVCPLSSIWNPLLNDLHSERV